MTSQASERKIAEAIADEIAERIANGQTFYLETSEGLFEPFWEGWEESLDSDNPT